MFDCFKKTNRNAESGETQSPHHPSNDSTPTYRPPAIEVNSRHMFALELTGRFEGKGWNQATTDFDGQGISLGIFQWCVGQGSLQEKILKPYFKKHGPANNVESILYDISKVGISQGLKITRSKLSKGNKFLSSAIKEGLEAFCLKAKPFQVAASKDVLNRAEGYASQFNMPSQRAFCWFVDICVQNGSLNGVAKPGSAGYSAFMASVKNLFNWQEYAKNPTQEIMILSMWTKARTKNNKWRDVVYKRKLSIAHGIGYVNGSYWLFDYDNLTVNKASSVREVLLG